METYQEKISLLQEMIDFALVDDILHDREYDFLEIVSQELEIDKPTFLKLFANRGKSKVIKDEFNRICQFYRLALLMHSDGVLHEREQLKINENEYDLVLQNDINSKGYTQWFYFSV